jgi:putative DNA primase/helicase
MKSPILPAHVPSPKGVTAFDPCSDIANGERIAENFHGQLLYVEGIGWHVWDPPWKHDELAARTIAYGLGKVIAREAVELARWAADAESSAERAEREAAVHARFRWASKTELSHNLEAALICARPFLAVKAADMDADPDLLGGVDSVLDLRTAEYRPYDPADRITKTLGVAFDRSAACPVWERFVSEVFANDCELADWFQRFMGYCLSGRRNEHLLPICWGSGGNGKSTLLGALQAMFGAYAGTAAPGLLIERGGSEHPTGIADLQGRRLVIASETGEGGRLAEEQIKALTGGDRITARRMRQDYYQFEPTHQLICQTNHKPRVRGTDDGIWRRLRLIPFVRKFTGGCRDPKLAEKLKAELPGIFNWCYRGYAGYRRHGLDDAPVMVRVATAEYRAASDVIGQFITDCCDVDPALTARAKTLYAAYASWCEGTGERCANQRDFGSRLGERGFLKHTNNGTVYRGLALRNP